MVPQPRSMTRHLLSNISAQGGLAEGVTRRLFIIDKWLTTLR
jgi:hypothetical protein